MAARNLSFAAQGSSKSTGDRPVQSLAGEWHFRTDPDHLAGISERWFEQRFQYMLTLPGSLDTNDKGTLNTEYSAEGLNHKFVPFAGDVWYQRDIEIPQAWAGRRVVLLLERCSTSRVWLDGREIGSAVASRRAPHLHELGEAASPGRHTLTILAGSAVLGRIELYATDQVWMQNVKVVPDIARKTARVSVEISNSTQKPATGTVRIEAQSFNSTRQHQPAPAEVKFVVGPGNVVAQGKQTFEGELAMGDGMLLWDESQPALYRLTATLTASGDGGASYADQTATSFGMREVAVRDRKLEINGRAIFLRGRSANGSSPLTNQPPFDVEGWRRFFRNNKDYGLNHLRSYDFPPDAAFEAADLEGVYIQAELGARSPVNSDKVDSLVAEGIELQETFGDHPSLCMFTLGNELYGERAALAEIVRRLRAADQRHLFASGSNNFWGAQEYQKGDDFWVTWRTQEGVDGDVRASYACCNLPEGHIELGPPNTEKDYSKSVDFSPVPVIAHEIGEFQVYPNYDEIPKYTGVMLPRNLELFRNRLVKAGMLDQWKDFFHASGALAVLCYKEDIEAAQRTPGFGGYQILELADCQVQGTALVGILDAFNDSKGLITPAQWRQFCNSTVPLLRFTQYTWRNNDTFVADAQVAHYGAGDLRNVVLEWSLKDQAGRVVQSGELPAISIVQGTAPTVGKLSIALKDLQAPARYNVELVLRGTDFRNAWPIWVYAASVDTEPPAGVKLVRSLDAAAQQELVDGQTVLLVPDVRELIVTSEMAGNFVDGQFQSDFWSFSMFHDYCEQLQEPPSPGTLGLLMDPSHPALAKFPSQFHTDWQWWHLIKNSRAVVLDEAPANCRPIVQMIDNVVRNYKLGIVFEFRVGKGRLLVCTADLFKLKDRPEAAQLLHSLLAYAASPDFQPSTTVDILALKSIMGIHVVYA